MAGRGAELEEWFYDNEEAIIIPFIERTFKSDYARLSEYSFMFKHLYFTKKVIENDILTNKQKLLKFFKMFSFGKSKIITIIGGRGSGKTAFAMYLVEEIFKSGHHKFVYYVKRGDRPDWLPKFIYHASSMEEVPGKSLAVIDETAIEYSSRNFYSDENKSFTDRLVILRHKDTSVILITQHSKLIDINIRRLSDILVYKSNANIEQEGKDQEETYLIMKKLIPKPGDKKSSLLVIKDYNAFWTVETGLASFWDDDKVSKTFKDYNPEQRRREESNKKVKAKLQELNEKERIKNEYRQAKEIDKIRNKVKKEEIDIDSLFEK